MTLVSPSETTVSSPRSTAELIAEQHRLLRLAKAKSDRANHLKVDRPDDWSEQVHELELDARDLRRLARDVKKQADATWLVERESVDPVEGVVGDIDITAIDPLDINFRQQAEDLPCPHCDRWGVFHGRMVSTDEAVYYCRWCDQVWPTDASATTMIYRPGPQLPPVEPELRVVQP